MTKHPSNPMATNAVKLRQKFPGPRRQPHHTCQALKGRTTGKSPLAAGLSWINGGKSPMRFSLTRLPVRAATGSAIQRISLAPNLLVASGGFQRILQRPDPVGLLAGNLIVQGERGAQVKAQGAYKVKSRRTIPKKLGPKRVHSMFSTRQ